MNKIAGNSYLTKKKGGIWIDNIELNKILENSRTPFFIFLENRVRDNIKTFLRVFKSIFKNIQVFYSFKANFLPEICNIIKSEGIGAELISLPELNLALNLGFQPDKILIGGPYITQEIIEKSVREGVKEIVVYDLDYLEKIDEVSQRLKKVQNICLRVKSGKFRSKLGIELNNVNLTKLINIKRKHKNIEISTILSHYSTQMNSVEQYNKNLNFLLDNFQILSENGFEIKNINLGGGFPEAVIMPERQLERLANNLKQKFLDLDLKDISLYLEPGRYFVGDSGIIIAKIINVLKNRWIFLNIGNNVCPKFAKCSLRFYNASKINIPHKYKTSIAGVIPTDQDVLVKNYFFPRELNKGDIVLITNVGAYALTFSNRFPYTLPDIFLVRNKDIKQIFDSDLDHDFSLI